MGSVAAVLLGLGLVVVCSAVFGQGYSRGEDVEESFFKDTRMALPNTERLNEQIYQSDSWLRASSLAVQTGRGSKPHKHSRMPSLRVGLKVLLLAVVVPALLAVVLYAAWKGVTLALLSLIISTIIGLKNLFSGHHHKHQQDDITYTHNVIVAKNPAFQDHLWKRDMPVLAHAIESNSPYRVVPATGLSSTV
ncbi:unnamed protein product [Nezara viridula]|uniref:Neuropeptide n=1 Tax=Nezara viridula TaxID=85310 RepID=A0A9P0H6S1_NEZVI|nr:unnamed protein product [Nezara viridula]